MALEKNLPHILQPSDWPRPRGYSNGIEAEGRLVFIAGQIGWNREQKIVSSSLVEQIKQSLQNIISVLKEAGASPQHLVRMTWYITDLDNYRRNAKEIGAAYRDIIGRHFPAMTLLHVKGLLEPDAQVEIEATAVVPLED